MLERHSIESMVELPFQAMVLEVEVHVAPTQDKDPGWHLGPGGRRDSWGGTKGRAGLSLSVTV